MLIYIAASFHSTSHFMTYEFSFISHKMLLQAIMLSSMAVD